jgi:hypothetical protein
MKDFADTRARAPQKTRQFGTLNVREATIFGARLPSKSLLTHGIIICEIIDETENQNDRLTPGGVMCMILPWMSTRGTIAGTKGTRSLRACQCRCRDLVNFVLGLSRCHEFWKRGPEGVVKGK